MGGAEVEVCLYIPLGNWLATFSFLLGCHARASLTKNIWLPKGAVESNSSFSSALQTSPSASITRTMYTQKP